MKPAIFVALVIACFACAMFPPLLMIAAAAALVAGIVKLQSLHARRKHHAISLARYRGYKVKRADEQAPITNPGWRL